MDQIKGECFMEQDEDLGAWFFASVSALGSAPKGTGWILALGRALPGWKQL